MSEFKSEYEITVPQTVTGILSLFKGGSTLSHIAAMFIAGVAWIVGYVSLGGGGTVTAISAGGALCGLVLGIAFTRALGGPVLNLILSAGWPFLFGGGMVLFGDIQIDRLYTASVVLALTWPAFFSAFGCLLVWFGVLGPERINDWNREHFPPAFYEETQTEQDAR